MNPGGMEYDLFDVSFLRTCGGFAVPRDGLHVIFGKPPSPFSYIRPSLVMPNASPASAALRHQCTACVGDAERIPTSRSRSSHRLSRGGLRPTPDDNPILLFNARREVMSSSDRMSFTRELCPFRAFLGILLQPEVAFTGVSAAVLEEKVLPKLSEPVRYPGVLNASLPDLNTFAHLLGVIRHLRSFGKKRPTRFI